MDPLGQRIPVEYELDKFNTPHTGTTLFHPQNCQLRCLIPLQHLATTSSLGHIFWRPHASPRNIQKHKLTETPKFISSNDKHDFRYILRTYFPHTSNNTRCYLNFLITPFRLFTSFHFYEACNTNANSIYHTAIKNYHKNISTSYIWVLLFLYFSQLSEETTQRKHTHVTTFPRPTMTNILLAKVCLPKNTVISLLYSKYIFFTWPKYSFILYQFYIFCENTFENIDFYIIAQFELATKMFPN